MAPKTTWTDDEILDALHLADQGMSRSKIGAKLGKTKNSVIGVLNRVEKETDLSEGRSK